MSNSTRKHELGGGGITSFFDGHTPLPPFVQPTSAEYRTAERIVDSHPVISAYGSCAWEELHDDGRVWLAAVVREAFAEGTQQSRPIPSDMIADVFGFVVDMAKRFRRRTSRRFLGIRINTMTRTQAMEHALATYDATLDMIGVPFGHPDYQWGRDLAHSFVDEELQHWEP